jgi:cytochrome b561
MSMDFPRYSIAAALLHALVAAGVLAALGLAGAMVFGAQAVGWGANWSEWHISISLIVTLLAFLQIGASLLAPADYPETFPKGRRAASKAASGFLRLALIVVLASGFARIVFAGAPLRFFGFEIPVFGEPNADYAAVAAPVHLYASFALAFAVLAHVIVTLANGFAFPGYVSRMSPVGPRGDAKALRLSAPPPAAAEKIARDLAGRFRLLGWLGFIVQAIFAVLSSLLLEFSAAGRALNAAHTDASDAIFWGSAALGALIVSCAVAFFAIRAARWVQRAPEAFLGARARSGFYFLLLGGVAAALGAVASMIGLALSIVLLIAKTVSQPPGIAIVDPDKIIRALDVFVLLVNFNLLIAHIFGGVLAIGLFVFAMRARKAYRAAAG